MTTLFISDLHLDAERPDATALFETYLAEEAPAADRLYVLGDLFEYWIGDDHRTPLSDRVADAFGRLRQRGTQIFFVAGNRDFLLGAEYAGRCRMRILSDPACIVLDGRKGIVSHGDMLCTDDVEYQQYRRQVRTPAWQAGFLEKSIPDRLDFARRARDASRSSIFGKSLEIMDVNDRAVADLLSNKDADLLIHGHTHRPAVHDLAGGRTRIVLGDWYDQGSALWCRGERLELIAI